MFNFDLQRFAIIKTMTDNAKISSVQTANSAISLSSAYALQVSLNNTSSSATFDGTSDVKTIGVKGVLQPAQGGTGVTSLDDLVVGSAKRIAGAQNVIASLNSSIIGNFNGIDTVVVGTRGVLPIDKGGTGRTTSPLVLTDLNSNSAVNIFQASPRPGVTGVLPVENGGTGVTDLSDLASLIGVTGKLETARNLRVSLNNTTEPTPFDGSQDADRIGVTGVLSEKNGGTGSTILSAISVGAANRLTEKHKFQVNLNSTLPSTGFDGTYDITDIGVKGVLPISLGGTGKTKLDALTVGATEQLKTARELQVSLNNTTETTMFDGSNDVKNIKVTGTLDISHGGTGTNDLSKITVGGAKNLSTKTSVVANLSSNVIGSFNGAETSTITVGTQGILPVDKGGTGRTDSPSMIVSLSSELEDTILKEYPRPGITGVLQSSHGGTGKEHLDQVQGIGSALKVINSSSMTSGTVDLVTGMINNDWAKVIVGSTASDKGYLELRTGDNGSEPIYVNQYNGVGNSISGSATILDENHNTHFPGTVTAAAFTGTVDVNDIAGILPVDKGGTGKDDLDKVTTGAAKKLLNSKTIVANLATSVATAFNGEQNITVGSVGILPVDKGGTGKTKLSDITVGTASSLQTARVLQVSLNNTTKETKFDGTLNVSDIKVAGILQPAQGGTGQDNLNKVTVGKANTLSTAHKLTVTLDDNVSIQSFDGTKDVTIGTDGVLPVKKGGTGATVLSAVTVGAASKLTPGAHIVTDLNKVGPQKFDGSASIATGVQGILPVSRGGTNSSISPSIIVNLSPEFAKKSVDLFDSTISGSKREIVAGATGVLPISLGGTGTSIPSAMSGIGSALRVINNQENTTSGSIDLVYGKVGTDWGMISFEREKKQSDYETIDDGSLHLKTGADGTEPIVVEQYKDLEGGSKEIKATALILDGSHNTKFPNTVFATEFIGSIAASNIIPTVQPHQGGTGQSDLMKVTVGTADSLMAQPILQVNLQNYNTTRLIGDRDLKDISINGTLQPIHGGTGKGNLMEVTVGTAHSLMAQPTLQVDLANNNTETVFIGHQSVRNIKVTGILDPVNGGTGEDDLMKVTVGHANSLTTARSIITSLPSDSVVSFDGTKNVTVSTVGVLPIRKGGTNMTVSPQLQVNLASDSRVDNFPATGANVNIGVSGILPVVHGGTGQDALNKVNGIGSALQVYNASYSTEEGKVILVQGGIATNDNVYIIAGANGSDQGYLKFLTEDNGNEPIIAEQRISKDNVTYTAYLLDENHNTSFPGSVTSALGFQSSNANITTIKGSQLTLSGALTADSATVNNLTVSNNIKVNNNIYLTVPNAATPTQLHGIAISGVTSPVILASLEDHPDNGHNILLQSYGEMIVASGEAGSNAYFNATNILDKNHEHLYMMSDVNAYIITNCQDISSNVNVCKTFIFDTNGIFTTHGIKVNTITADVQVTGGAVLNNTTISHVPNDTRIVTANTIAYWNGRYNNSASNLAYCSKGAFGDIVTKNISDFVQKNMSYNKETSNYIPYAGEITTSNLNNMSTVKSGFYSAYISNTRYNVYNNVRNNGTDGTNGIQIFSKAEAADNLYWRQMFGGVWQAQKTIIDSSNIGYYTAKTISDILPISKGGTNATIANEAVRNLFGNHLSTDSTKPVAVMTVTNNFQASGYTELNVLRHYMGLGNSTGVLAQEYGGTGKANLQNVSVGSAAKATLADTATLANTATLATRATVADDLRNCTVGHGGNTVTNTWFKVATSPAIGTPWKELTIAFLVSDIYDNSSSSTGILKIHIKTDANGIPALTDQTNVQWLSITGYDPNDFVLTLPKTASGNCVLWTCIRKSNQKRKFVVLSECDWYNNTDNWILGNTVGDGDLKTLPTTDSQMISTIAHLKGTIDTADTVNDKSLENYEVGISGTDLTKKWLKVATTSIDSGNKDRNIVLLVDDTFGPDRIGILRVHVRLGLVTEGDKKYSQINYGNSGAKWLVNQNYDAQNIALTFTRKNSLGSVLSNESDSISLDNNEVMEITLWTRVINTYSSRRFTILHHFSGGSSQPFVPWVFNTHRNTIGDVSDADFTTYMETITSDAAESTPSILIDDKNYTMKKPHMFSTTPETSFDNKVNFNSNVKVKDQGYIYLSGGRGFIYSEGPYYKNDVSVAATAKSSVITSNFSYFTKGVLTNNVKDSTKPYYYSKIKSDFSGEAVVFQAGQNMIIGAGEAPQHIYFGTGPEYLNARQQIGIASIVSAQCTYVSGSGTSAVFNGSITSDFSSTPVSFSKKTATQIDTLLQNAVNDILTDIVTDHANKMVSAGNIESDEANDLIADYHNTATALGISTLKYTVDSLNSYYEINDKRFFGHNENLFLATDGAITFISSADSRKASKIFKMDESGTFITPKISLTAGALPISQGGTGATDPVTARTNLGITGTGGTTPSNCRIIAGTSSSTVNAAATGPVYLHLFDGSTRNSSLTFYGSGGTSIKSDAKGNITISSSTVAAGTGSTYPVYDGTNTVPALVPVRQTTTKTRFLREDGVWTIPPDTNTTYSVATTAKAGLMPKLDPDLNADKYLNGAGLWSAVSFDVPTATSTSTGGIKLSGKANQYLNGQGKWATISSDSDSGGGGGTVTSAQAGYIEALPNDASKFFNGKGAWISLSDTNVNLTPYAKLAGANFTGAVTLGSTTTIKGTTTFQDQVNFASSKAVSLGANSTLCVNNSGWIRPTLNRKAFMMQGGQTLLLGSGAAAGGYYDAKKEYCWTRKLLGHSYITKSVSTEAQASVAVDFNPALPSTITINSNKTLSYPAGFIETIIGDSTIGYRREVFKQNKIEESGFIVLLANSVIDFVTNSNTTDPHMFQMTREGVFVSDKVQTNTLTANRVNASLNASYIDGTLPLSHGGLGKTFNSLDELRSYLQIPDSSGSSASPNTDFSTMLDPCYGGTGPYGSAVYYCQASTSKDSTTSEMKITNDITKSPMTGYIERPGTLVSLYLQNGFSNVSSITINFNYNGEDVTTKAKVYNTNGTTLLKTMTAGYHLLMFVAQAKYVCLI